MLVSLMSIEYHTDRKITTEQFIQILKDSTLAERRPVNDSNRMQKMVKNAAIMISAWDENLLVGIARSISDFAHWTYLADLAVHQKYHKKGIGKKLIELTRTVTGEDVNMILIAAPAAKDYYGHLGFSKNEQSWVLWENDTLK